MKLMNDGCIKGWHIVNKQNIVIGNIYKTTLKESKNNKKRANLKYELF